MSIRFNTCRCYTKNNLFFENEMLNSKLSDVKISGHSECIDMPKKITASGSQYTDINEVNYDN